MKEEEGGTLTMPNHLLLPRGYGGHIVYSVIFATFMLDYIQLSLTSYFIIGVLHRSGETYLGVHLTLLSCSSELWEAEPTKVCWLERKKSSSEKADLCGKTRTSDPRHCSFDGQTVQN